MLITFFGSRGTKTESNIGKCTNRNLTAMKSPSPATILPSCRQANRFLRTKFQKARLRNFSRQRALLRRIQALDLKSRLKVRFSDHLVRNGGKLTSTDFN